VDWPSYRFLTRQQDLVPIYRGQRITLFENEASRGDVFGLEEGTAVAVPSELFGSDEEREVASRLFSSTPLVSGENEGFPALARRLPAAREVLSAGARSLRPSRPLGRGGVSVPLYGLARRPAVDARQRRTPPDLCRRAGP
jgi:hypothetical protein